MIIPFFIPHAGCPHQCVFCNQRNITGQNHPDDASAIPDKISRYLSTHDSHEPVEIAFYGGSFTALPLEVQQTYLETVRPFIQAGRVRNIRLSTRPDCISKEILRFLKEYHVTIIELGAQSMDDNVLLSSGRGHSTDDTMNAVKLLKEHGFAIGLQLMPGLPGDTAKDFIKKTIDQVVTIKPGFVRLYPVLVIKGTPLEKLCRNGCYHPLILDEAVALCCDAIIKLEHEGIDVIRVGLQPTEELEKPGTILAGPFHPAFRQLVESSIFLDGMRSALKERKGTNDTAVFSVNPKDISLAVGQRRGNIRTLMKEFKLKKIRIVEDSSIRCRKREMKLSSS
jgi:histone acetyltransferase (RNA polymerase elongator complex component)